MKQIIDRALEFIMSDDVNIRTLGFELLLQYQDIIKGYPKYCDKFLNCYVHFSEKFRWMIDVRLRSDYINFLSKICNFTIAQNTCGLIAVAFGLIRSNKPEDTTFGFKILEKSYLEYVKESDLCKDRIRTIYLKLQDKPEKVIQQYLKFAKLVNLDLYYVKRE